MSEDMNVRLKVETVLQTLDRLCSVETTSAYAYHEVLCELSDEIEIRMEAVKRDIAKMET